jgi:prevent-host-death family protein
MSVRQVNVHEAKTHLSRLLSEVEAGDEVVVARAGHPVARLVPYKSARQPRQLGLWRGRVRVSQDFDELPPELASAFAGEND